eukprot:350136-Chlamydomonas_euryale.AAC.3
MYQYAEAVRLDSTALDPGERMDLLMALLDAAPEAAPAAAPVAKSAVCGSGMGRTKSAVDKVSSCVAAVCTRGSCSDGTSRGAVTLLCTAPERRVWLQLLPRPEQLSRPALWAETNGQRMLLRLAMTAQRSGAALHSAQATAARAGRLQFARLDSALAPTVASCRCLCCVA